MKTSNLLFSFMCTLLLGFTITLKGQNLTTLDKVGIGTTTPASKLEIQTGSDSLGILINRASANHPGGVFFTYKGNNKMLIGGLQADRDFGGSAKGGIQILSANSRPIQFFTKGANKRTGIYDTEEAMRINGDGNIGVGTINPTSKLQVLGGKLNVGYKSGQFTAADLDKLSGNLGTSGIAANYGGDLYTRSYWGVVIDRRGGNAGLGNYTNGINPDGGSFAVRYRIDDTNFRTDFLINKDGNVGVGMINPREKLGVNGNIVLTRNTNRSIFIEEEPDNNAGGKSLTIKAGNASSTGIPNYAMPGGNLVLQAGNGYNSYEPGYDGGDVILRSGANHLNGSDNGGDIVFETGGATNSFLERMRIHENGAVGIGVPLSDFAENHKLSVGGKIACEEVRVQLKGNWPDYVFQQNYELTTLEEVEQYIQKEQHLPGLPSADQVKKEGIVVGEIQGKLLEKIEELTLYTIEQQKQIEQLLQITTQQQQQIEVLKKKK